jgi:hypothetical protein
MTQSLGFGEAMGRLAPLLGVHSKEFTKLNARARIFIKGRPGQAGWARLLRGSGRQGRPMEISPHDLLALYIALRLNLSGIMPSVAVPAAKRALTEFPAGGRRLDGSLAVPITLDPTLGEQPLSFILDLPVELVKPLWRAA